MSWDDGNGGREGGEGGRRDVWAKIERRRENVCGERLLEEVGAASTRHTPHILPPSYQRESMCGGVE